MLEAETRYLPLHSELGLSPLGPLQPAAGERPVTAPPGQQTTSTFAEVFAGREERRPRTADRDDRNNNSARLARAEPANYHFQNQMNMYNVQKTGYDRLNLQGEEVNARYSPSAENRRLAANVLSSASDCTHASNRRSNAAVST